MGGGSGAEDEESNAGHHERGGLVLVDERVGIASMSAGCSAVDAACNLRHRGVIGEGGGVPGRWAGIGAEGGSILPLR